MPARPEDAPGSDGRGSGNRHWTPEDRALMRSALGLAGRALGRCWPNPAVGALVVKDGRIVGRGWTRPGGRPHAETEALSQAGTAARGATAYVTLEPCAHHGRTPPCADALASSGITRVVVPMIDPDPRVSGRGVARLEAAGIAVDLGCLAAEAAEINRGFLTRISSGRPMVTLKLAQSLDGRIATAAGESRWITGEAARRQVHLDRARADAVLIGAGTARADDPRLDVRGIGLAAASPIRVVLASHLDLPPDGALARSARELPLWLCHAPDAALDRRVRWAATGATLIEVPRAAGRLRGLDAGLALAALGARGLTRVLCEGGGELAADLLAADLVDEIVVYGAGLVLGAEGRPSIGQLGLTSLAEAPRLRLTDCAQIGPDYRARWRRD